VGLEDSGELAAFIVATLHVRESIFPSWCGAFRALAIPMLI
jgi:hypothetical protein